MIRTLADIEAALLALRKADPRLEAVVSLAGPVPLRLGAPGLRGFLGTIVAQQVSRASADAIFARFAGEFDLDDAEALRTASDEALRRAGLSRPKMRTVRAIAEAVATGALDFGRLERLDAASAIEEMTAIHGVGRWTAECHLLFALGHPDVFPAGDLALQVAVAHALALPERPKEKPLAAIAEVWSPHRATAARLFWSYYHVLTRRDAAPALAENPSPRLRPIVHERG